jgi:hypothetical protein
MILRNRKNENGVRLLCLIVSLFVCLFVWCLRYARHAVPPHEHGNNSIACVSNNVETMP